MKNTIKIICVLIMWVSSYVIIASLAAIMTLLIGPLIPIVGGISAWTVSTYIFIRKQATLIFE